MAVQFDQLLTIEQAAKLLLLSRAKVYLLIEYEGLPVVRFGRRVRINPESLRAWIMDREQRSV